MEQKWGEIYVIDFGDMKNFKIGYTTVGSSNRLNTIGKGPVLMPNKMELVMSFEVTTNVRAVESLMHLKFDGYRVKGEWFDLGFVELVELYQAMYGLSVRRTLHNRWFEIVPNDYENYIEHCAINPTILPHMTIDEHVRHFESMNKVKDLWGALVNERQK